MFQYADARAALANQVTGHETPAQLAELQKKDKALELDQVQAKFNYAYGNAWQEQLEAIQKKKMEQKKRLFDLGFLYG